MQDAELLRRISELEKSLDEEKKKNSSLEDELEKVTKQLDETEEDESEPLGVQNPSFLKLQEARELQWRRTPAYWEHEEKEKEDKNVSNSLKDKEKDESLARALRFLTERERELDNVREVSRKAEESLKAELVTLTMNRDDERNKARRAHEELESLREILGNVHKSGNSLTDSSKEEVVFLEQQISFIKMEIDRESQRASTAEKDVLALNEERLALREQLIEQKSFIQELLPLKDQIATLKKQLEEAWKEVGRLSELQANRRGDTDEITFLEQQLSLITEERDSEKKKRLILENELEAALQILANSKEKSDKCSNCERIQNERFADELGKLTKDLKSQALKDIEQVKKDAETTVSRLQTTVEKLQMENKVQLQAGQRLMRQLEETEDANQALEDRCAALLKASHDAASLTVMAEPPQERVDISVVEELRRDLLRLTEERDEARLAVEANEASLRQSQSEVADLTRTLEALKAEAASAVTRLQETEKERDSYAAMIKMHEDASSSAQAHSADSPAKQAYNRLEAMVMELTEGKNEAVNRADSATRELSLLKLDCDRLKHDLVQEKTSHARATEQLASLTSTQQQLDAKLAEEQNECAKAKQMEQELRSRLEAARLEFESSKERHSSKVLSMTSELVTATTRAEEEGRKVADLDMEVTSLRQDKEKLVVIVSEMESLMAELSALRQDKKATVTALTEERNEAIRRVEMLTKDLNVLQTERDGLRRALDESDQTEERSRSEIARLQQQLESEKQRCRVLEEGLPNGGMHMEGSRDSYANGHKALSGPPTLSLLETRLQEALHLQYMAALRQRASGLYWQQTDRIRGVISSLDALEVEATELKLLAAEMEKKFSEERQYAQLLSLRFDQSLLTVRGEVLAAVEPEMEAMDTLFATLSPESLRSLNLIADGINSRVGYVPGETLLKQDVDENLKAVGGGVLELYQLRVEATKLRSDLSRLTKAIASRFPSASAGEARLKTLDRCFQVVFAENKGDYAMLLDVASAWLEFPSVDAIKECLFLLAEWASANSEQQHSVRALGVDVPVFRILAVKNRLNPNFDARQYSAGYRDCFINLQLPNSRYPLHVVELQLRLSMFTDRIKAEVGRTSVSEGDFWPIRVFQASRPLKLFDMDLRIHIGPVTQDASELLRDGLVSKVQMDHFPFSRAGGGLLSSSLASSKLGTLTTLSVHDSGILDNEFATLIQSVKGHPRIRTVKASGVADIPGTLRLIPWLDFKSLKSLTELDLSFNQIEGPLPPNLSSCIPSIQKLVLHCNSLTGSIPPDVGNLCDLKYLILSRNKLSGPLPAALGKLQALKDLQLWQNQFIGPIPSELGELSGLLRLSVDNCFLSGELPPSLGNMKSLQELHCFDNQISGSIPPEMGRLSQLVFLGLNGNQLQGRIPAELGQLSRLKKLFLHGNKLTGSIPSELGSLSELQKLSLRSNLLTGTLPVTLSLLSKLEAFTVSDNQLNGEILDGIGSLTRLEGLSMSGNQLEGSIPPVLGQLRCLRTLELQNNKLSGPIPPQLGSLSQLDQLLLFGNQICGEIPATLGDLSNLTILDLQNNILQGNIPMSLCQLTKLQSLSLDKNQLIGTKRAQYFLEKRLPACYVDVDAEAAAKGTDSPVS